MLSAGAVTLTGGWRSPRSGSSTLAEASFGRRDDERTEERLAGAQLARDARASSAVASSRDAAIPGTDRGARIDRAKSPFAREQKRRQQIGDALREKRSTTSPRSRSGTGRSRARVGRGEAAPCDESRPRCDAPGRHRRGDRNDSGTSSILAGGDWPRACHRCDDSRRAIGRLDRRRPRRAPIPAAPSSASRPLRPAARSRRRGSTDPDPSPTPDSRAARGTARACASGRSRGRPRRERVHIMERLTAAQRVGLGESLAPSNGGGRSPGLFRALRQPVSASRHGRRAGRVRSRPSARTPRRCRDKSRSGTARDTARPPSA